jgi:hypothetical protein
VSHQPSRSPPWGNLGFGSVIIPSLLLLVATGGLRLRFHLLRTALRHSRSAWVHRRGAALREVRPECIGEVCYYWWPREASVCGSTFSDEPCGTRGVRGYIGGARRSGKSAQNASAKFAFPSVPKRSQAFPSVPKRSQAFPSVPKRSQAWRTQLLLRCTCWYAGVRSCRGARNYGRGARNYGRGARNYGRGARNYGRGARN